MIFRSNVAEHLVSGVGVLCNDLLNSADLADRVCQVIILGIGTDIGFSASAGGFQFQNGIDTVRQLVEAFSCDDHIIVAAILNGSGKGFRLYKGISFIQKHDAVPDSVQTILPVCIRQNPARPFAMDSNAAASAVFLEIPEHLDKCGFSGGTVTGKDCNVPLQL